jgi:AcrR family transcriptional regulator
MAGMAAQRPSERAAAWGADIPGSEGEARDRLLDAAEDCFAERGPSRTRMSDIADRARVHRRTIYDYFPTKDALVAASFVRAITAVLDASESCWRTDEPFLEQLANALLVGMEATRKSPAMRLLLDGEELGRTYRAAEASEIWNKNLSESLGQRIAAASASGEVRADVSPEMMAHWVVRLGFSLLAEPGRPEDGGDEAIVRAFLPASLTSR